jgi:transposase
MKAYSLDLRQKIIESYEAGGISQRQLASRFRVSTFFVVKVLGLHRRGEQLQAKCRGGRVKPLLTLQMREYLRDRLAAQNDLSLAELSHLIEAEFGLTVSPPTVCRALQQMNLRRKKRAFLPASE